MLREAGQQGCEALVLWAGQWVKTDAGSFAVEAALRPEQQAIRTEDGVAVMVDADALFEMNASLNARGLRLVAQLHTHPGEAYHSATDDRFSVVTARGGFSLVVPDFATAPLAIESCAAYRLEAGGAWAELTTREAVSMIRIVED